MDSQLADSIRNTQTKSSYIEAYDFEVYDIFGTIDLFKTYRPVLYLTVILYLLGIYFGKKWMENRPAYKLTRPLFFWNLGLALFSIISTIRLLPETAFVLSQPDGLYHSLCDGKSTNYATSFWGLLFALSKFVELGDTAFIILRKQKLIVLHWFHHLTTLTLCYAGYELYDPAGGRYIVGNAFVHSLMYSYYALKAVNVKIPRRISKLITTVQIAQMVIFIYVNLASLYFMVTRPICYRNMNLIYYAAFLYAIFLTLFINFFRQSYSSRGNKSKSKIQ